MCSPTWDKKDIEACTKEVIEVDGVPCVVTDELIPSSTKIPFHRHATIIPIWDFVEDFNERQDKLDKLKDKLDTLRDKWREVKDDE